MRASRIPDGVGRSIFIAALAGIMFAAFLLVTPRLTASTGDTIPGPVSPAETTTTSLAATTTAADTSTTIPVTTTTTSAPTSTILRPADGYDGTVVLGLYFEGEADGKEARLIEDGDTIEWRLHVTNASEGTLWGVFAYLELHGPVPCDDRILEPGESTDCWIESAAVEGNHTAEAWVNAWTLTRMVKDKVFAELVVLP